ncbi:hypothetical protein QBC44DRAFT_364171 [Cladorrhinum sp. PSN332]|nr:hypothetical protein QBC44DRAFT_364171 [Cladorrhinum sp. PSN332]
MKSTIALFLFAALSTAAPAALPQSGTLNAINRRDGSTESDTDSYFKAKRDGTTESDTDSFFKTKRGLTGAGKQARSPWVSTPDYVQGIPK